MAFFGPFLGPTSGIPYPSPQKNQKRKTKHKVAPLPPKTKCYFGKPKKCYFWTQDVFYQPKLTNSVQKDSFWSQRLIQNKHSSKNEQCSREQQIHPRMTNWAQNDNCILEWHKPTITNQPRLTNQPGMTNSTLLKNLVQNDKFLPNPWMTKWTQNNKMSLQPNVRNSVQHDVINPEW